MRYAVRHETRYRYGRPVDLGYHLLRLTPANIAHQILLGQKLTIEPPPTRLSRFTDHFGNTVHHAAVEATHDHFEVTFEAQVEIAGDVSSLPPGLPWENIRAVMQADGFASPPGVAEFVYGSPLAPLEPEATSYAARSFTAKRSILDGLRELNGRIHADFSYAPNRTDVSTRVAEVLTTREGVCQDFAHVMIAGLRGLGLPARYVSGYIRTRPRSGEAARQGADASHAWVSAWCGPEIGWIELDPTNDLLVSDEHVVVAYGRDFSDVTPLRGVILGGGNHTLNVAVSVTDLGRDGAVSA
jgi:transglutaminase-like putative cysteine protease